MYPFCFSARQMSKKAGQALPKHLPSFSPQDLGGITQARDGKPTSQTRRWLVRWFEQ
jgi:hypothetical protein